MTSVAVDLFTAPTAGLPSKPQTKATYVLAGFHVASQRRPKTVIGFSRWAPDDPAVRVPRVERDHWAIMKRSDRTERTSLPKLPTANEVCRATTAPRQSAAEKVSTPPEVPAEEVASKEEQRPLDLPIALPQTAREAPPSGIRRVHGGLMRSLSAREHPSNNCYHIRAKAGYRYWFEDPDDTPQRITAYAKWGTPFGARNTFFGLGFSPRK